jgi:hypothetical protein
LGEEFHHNQVTLISSQIANVPPALRNRWSRDRLHQTVMRLCAGGRLDPMPLVSRVIPATQAAEAYRLLDSPPAELMQVILSFDESSFGGQGGSSPARVDESSRVGQGGSSPPRDMDSE